MSAVFSHESTWSPVCQHSRSFWLSVAPCRRPPPPPLPPRRVNGKQSPEPDRTRRTPVGGTGCFAACQLFGHITNVKSLTVLKTFTYE